MPRTQIHQLGDVAERYIVSNTGRTSKAEFFREVSAPDAVNTVKQASEFQISGKQAIASLAMLVNDVKALGLKDAHGLRITESFYCDLDDRSRAWSSRYAAKMNGSMPSMIQAGTYSAVLFASRAEGRNKKHE